MKTSLSEVQFDALLRDQEAKPTLRFLTCGSVDDGKSTLIGRLLYDSKLLFDDQLLLLEHESKVYGTTGGELDLALLLDGLQAEREQGITIDVAYRFFTTNHRRFIVADTPGHEQYTRNMATGASTAQLAVLLVDARKGIRIQTRRHSYIVNLFGIRHLILAVNKMDLVGFDQGRFETIESEFRVLGKELSLKDIVCIPVSALNGDNVFKPSAHMSWYRGPTLMQHLEAVDVSAGESQDRFRMSVQWVNRPGAEFRGYSGRVAAGTVRSGDTVTVHPSGRVSRVSRVVSADGDLDGGIQGQSITLTLEDDLDISRGDLLAAGQPPLVADQFAAHLLWMDDDPMLPGRQYLMHCGTAATKASISSLKYRVDANTTMHEAATTLKLNEIGRVNLHVQKPIACDSFLDCPGTGAFILIDPFTNRTVGAGVIEFALRRATNISWQHLDVDKAARSRLKEQRPCVLWFTGLSGAGKSTIANLVEKQLFAMGRHTFLLDGDNLRHGLNSDLGFTAEGRVENVRRVAELSKLFVEGGMLCLVSLISPFRAERIMARELLQAGEFIEVYISTPLEEAERRDPKGLYARARSGHLPNFTGIDSPYEEPEAPEITVDTITETAEEAAERIVDYLRRNEYF